MQNCYEIEYASLVKLDEDNCLNKNKNESERNMMKNFSYWLISNEFPIFDVNEFNKQFFSYDFYINFDDSSDEMILAEFDVVDDSDEVSCNVMISGLGNRPDIIENQNFIEMVDELNKIGNVNSLSYFISDGEFKCSSWIDGELESDFKIENFTKMLYKCSNAFKSVMNSPCVLNMVSSR